MHVISSEQHQVTYSNRRPQVAIEEKWLEIMYKGLRHFRNVLQRGSHNLARCHAYVTHMSNPNAVAAAAAATGLPSKLCGAAGLNRQLIAPALQPLSWRQVSGGIIETKWNTFNIMPHRCKCCGQSIRQLWA